MRTFCLFTLVCFIANSQLASYSISSRKHSFISSNSSSTNISVSQSENVTIYRDDYGFYVNVDLAYHPSDASDSDSSSHIVPMMLSLVTSKTLLATSCKNFSYYDCDFFRCDPLNKAPTTQSFLYFAAEGYEAATFAYLDYKYWNLESYALVATNCTTNNKNPLGQERYGMLGLGFGYGGILNFMGLPLFAISINKNVSGGQLTFFQDLLTEVKPNTVEYVLKSFMNYGIDAYNSSLQIGTSAYPFNSTIVLDLNVDILGFPHYIYAQIITLLRREAKVRCKKSVNIRPYCSYSGRISDLPDIILNVQNYTIPISPQLYVMNASNITSNVSSIVLNIKALSYLYHGENYVDWAYENYIILDANFMSQYYIVFNVTDHGVVVVLANSDPRPDSEKDSNQGNNMKWAYIIFGCVGVVVFSLLAWCCYQFKKRGKKSRVHEHRDLTQKNEEPLILNHAESQEIH